MNRSLPQAKQNEGFKGIIALGDRQSGKTLYITLRESEETVRASEEEANRLRSESPPVCYIPVGWPHQRVSALRNASSWLAGALSSVAQATYPSGRTNTIGSAASAGVAESTR